MKCALAYQAARYYDFASLPLEVVLTIPAMGRGILNFKFLNFKFLVQDIQQCHHSVELLHRLVAQKFNDRAARNIPMRSPTVTRAAQRLLFCAAAFQFHSQTLA